MGLRFPSPGGSPLAGPPEPAPPFACRTDAPPVAGQPLPSAAGCRGGLELAFHSRGPQAEPGARRLSPRPAHPPPRMSQPRLRADPCRPGRGRLRVPHTSDRRQGHLGHPSSKEGEVPGFWSASPGESAPVTPSLPSLPPRGSATSQGPALPSNSLGQFGPLQVDSGPDAPSSGPPCAVGNRLSSLQPSFPLPSRPPPRPSPRLPYRHRGRSPPLP